MRLLIIIRKWSLYHHLHGGHHLSTTHNHQSHHRWHSVPSHASLIQFKNNILKEVIRDNTTNGEHITADADEKLAAMILGMDDNFISDPEMTWYMKKNMTSTRGIPDMTNFELGCNLQSPIWKCNMTQVCRAYNIIHLQRMIQEKISKSSEFLFNLCIGLRKKLDINTFLFTIAIWVPNELINASIPIVIEANQQLYDSNLPFIVQTMCLPPDLDHHMFGYIPIDQYLFRGYHGETLTDIIPHAIKKWHMVYEFNMDESGSDSDDTFYDSDDFGLTIFE